MKGEAPPARPLSPTENRIVEVPAEIAALAANHLADTHPHFSARSGLTAVQRAGAWGLVGAGAMFAWIRPDALSAVLEISVALVFGALVLFRIMAAIATLLGKTVPRRPLLDSELPSVTYLVPLHREANMAHAIVSAIEAIDYPRERLQVLFLTEADDRPTIEALLRTVQAPWMSILVCPSGLPRTKPRALNCGLAYATGELVAVLDAEDRPDPAQARAAAAAFARGGPRLGVVQAPLLANNTDAGWITRQFSVEYAAHFLVWLTLVARLNLPMPLGGTSNYFRRDALRKVGAWDAWNVTEDADLGLRLARFGYGAQMIAPATWEEAPIRFEHWLSQRTRWLKGHIQTCLVQMRSPLRGALDMGPGRYAVALVMLGGGLLSAMLHGPMLAWLGASFLFPGARIESWQAMLLGAGYGSVAAAALASRQPALTAWIWITWPLYWMLMSLAMLRALIEIRWRPHYWAKTPHGVPAKRILRAA